MTHIIFNHISSARTRSLLNHRVPRSYCMSERCRHGNIYFVALITTIWTNIAHKCDEWIMAKQTTNEDDLDKNGGRDFFFLSIASVSTNSFMLCIVIRWLAQIMCLRLYINEWQCKHIINIYTHKGHGFSYSHLILSGISEESPLKNIVSIVEFSCPNTMQSLGSFRQGAEFQSE